MDEELYGDVCEDLYEGLLFGGVVVAEDTATGKIKARICIDSKITPWIEAVSSNSNTLERPARKGEGILMSGVGGEYRFVMRVFYKE